MDPNFELLAATNGFPFILPGNVGMAWYDSITTAQSQHEIVMEQIENVKMKYLSTHFFIFNKILKGRVSRLLDSPIFIIYKAIKNP